MHVDRTDNINFGAGNVYLKRVNPENVLSYKAIKKIAEDKGMDIFISKNKETKYLPREDMYMVMAIKERPIMTRGFFRIGNDVRHGVGCAIMSKKTKPEELAVRIYNATMNAIDVLEKKLETQKV